MSDFTINVQSIGLDERLSDEKLEQAFRDAEEASERRLEELEDEEEGRESSPAPLSGIATNLNALGSVKKRRRGSISISRVGTLPELSGLQSDLPTPTVGANPSPVPWAPSTPYRTQNGSASSLTSDDGESSEVDHATEENHVTQKQTIVGRRNTISKAVGSVFARTLPRMRSLHGLSDMIAQEEVVIGVKVHESTTEEKKVREGALSPGAPHADSEAKEGTPTSTSTSQQAAATASVRNSFVGVSGPAVISVDAAGSTSSTQSKRNSLRTQTSSRSLPESTAETKKRGDEKEGSRNLMYYARLLAQKFRRRSVSSKRMVPAKAASSDDLKKAKLSAQMDTLPEERAKSEDNKETSKPVLSSISPSVPISISTVLNNISPPTPITTIDAASPASIPLPPSPIASGPPSSIL